MKSPGPVLAIDARVLIAAARGRNSDVLITAGRTRHLVVTQRAVTEARRRIEFGLKRTDLLPVIEGIVATITVLADEFVNLHLENAGQCLKDAVASQNGSSRDAHILACAWATGADIWSFDRDFAGTGVASWSTANLMSALAAERRQAEP
jgi:predicted nucleic acid-binding protein